MRPEVGDIVTMMISAGLNSSGRRVPTTTVIRRDVRDARAHGMDYHDAWAVPDFVDDLIEGVDWCRGTGRADVEALLAAQALL